MIEYDNAALRESCEALLSELVDLLEGADLHPHKEQLFLSGGYVRDWLAGVQPKDIDIFVPLGLLSDLCRRANAVWRDACEFQEIGLVRYDGDRFIAQYQSKVSDLKVQLVSTHDETLETVLDRFDWSICKVGYCPERQAILGIPDVLSGDELRTERFEDCRRTLKRGFRFEEKFGKQMHPSDLQKLCLGVATEIAPTLVSRMEGKKTT